MSQVKEFLRQRQAERKQVGKHLSEKYTNQAQLLAQDVLEASLAEEVYLYGSILREADFRPESDVDIAFGVVDDERFLELLDHVETRFGSLEQVDITVLEDCPDTLREKIINQGRQLIIAGD